MFDLFFSLFEQQPVLFLGTLFVLGAVVGSFLNVVIYRLPVMMQREWRHDCLEFLEQADETETEKFNLSVPRSRCGSCGHQITILENIPISGDAPLSKRIPGRQNRMKLKKINSARGFSQSSQT